MKNDKTTMSTEEEVYEIYNRTGYRKPDGTWTDKQKQFDYDDMIGFGEMVKEAYARQTQPRWVSDDDICRLANDEGVGLNAVVSVMMKLRDLIFNGEKTEAVDLEQELNKYADWVYERNGTKSGVYVRLSPQAIKDYLSQNKTTEK